MFSQFIFGIPLAFLSTFGLRLKVNKALRKMVTEKASRMNKSYSSPGVKYVEHWD